MGEEAKVRKIPSWLSQNEDGTWTALIREKEYVFQELKGREIESAKNISEKLKKAPEPLIAAKSLVSPKMNESDLPDLPGGVYLKIIGAVNYVYELDNFLG